MRIVMANNIYPPIMAGGAELIVSYLSEELVRRGHEVTVVSTCGPEMEPYPVEWRNGVEVVRFFPKNLYWSYARGYRKPEDVPVSKLSKYWDGVQSARWHFNDSWNKDTGRHVADVYRRIQPDILHTHVINGMSATVWREARNLGIGVVHTAHDYHLLCPRAFMLSRSWKICNDPTLACKAYRAWHLHTTNNIDLFTSPSQFLLDLHRQAGMHSGRDAVVHNGIPLSLTERPNKTGPRNKFLYLTRLTQDKGVRVVLEAMSRLPPEFPIEITIAGRGPLEPEIRQAAAADSRIRYLGYIHGDEKHQALLNADHLILPSLWYENAPIVILEAAAYGLNLIASRIGGIPEFVKVGETGRLFEPGDADSLGATMMRSVSDVAMLDAIPQHGANLVAKFTVDRMVDNFLEQYGQVLATRAQRVSA